MHEESLFESTLQRRAMHFLDVLHFVWQHTHTHTQDCNTERLYGTLLLLFIYLYEIYIAFAIS